MAGKEGDFGVPEDLLQALISAFSNIVSSLQKQQFAQDLANKAKAGGTKSKKGGG